jgi:hypothetical protein
MMIAFSDMERNIRVKYNSCYSLFLHERVLQEKEEMKVKYKVNRKKKV